MSDLSNLAITYLGQQDLEAAVQMAAKAVHECPGDWHTHYALGQCLRFCGISRRQSKLWRNPFKW